MKRPSPPLDNLYADRVLAEAIAATKGMSLTGRATVLGRYSLRIYTRPSESTQQTSVAWLLFSGTELIGTGRFLVENDVFARSGIAVIAKPYQRQGLYAAVLPILRKKLGVPIESDVSLTAGAIGAWKRAGGKLTDRQGDKVFRINPMKFTLTISPRTSFGVKSLRAASDLYQRLRDESGEGASTWPEGLVYEGKKLVARISYNGRVWPPEAWTPSTKPLLERTRSNPSIVDSWWARR